MVKIFIALLLALFLYGLGVAQAVTLGVSGRNFTVDGRKVFLYGVSYFDVVNWKKSDLRWLKAHGFGLIRVWANWDFSISNSGGSLLSTSGEFAKDCPNEYGELVYDCGDLLVNLVDAANELGIIVDVTILHADSKINNGRAVESTAKILKSRGNVLIDIANEANVHNSYSVNDGKELYRRYKSIAPNHIVTMSYVDSAHSYALAMGHDAITPHFPRQGKNFYDKVYERTKELMALTTKPIYLQEEDRNGWAGASYTAAQLEKAAREANRAGAAAYIFHQDSGFFMGERNRKGWRCFKDGLDEEELKAIARLNGI